MSYYDDWLYSQRRWADAFWLAWRETKAARDKAATALAKDKLAAIRSEAQP